MTTKIIPVEGIIDLSEKSEPLCTLDPPFSGKCCVTRAIMDITDWKKQLGKLAEDFWQDENQSGNVKLIRPAHDAWGIQKIVFTFCDDYLQRVYDLPYSQHPDWKPLLSSVYQALNIKEDRVVRSLLARMPEGVTIPVHHDTGYWVRHTHRCHLALVTGEEVEFWVGPTPDSMEQYSFDEGRIVELNNQAKHRVSNFMPNKRRVHLIFDYVDEDFVIKSRLLLTPDDVIHQTRRSIDLERDVRNYKVEASQPRFIIIGAQKSGTTSLYEYICQHPLVVRGKRRETHYFDWRFNRQLDRDDVRAHRNYYLNFFEREVLQAHPSLITGESTPSYLLHSALVLPRLKSYVPWCKLIILLRNPVDRAYSQYEMIQDPNGTPEQLKNRGKSKYGNKSFEEIIEEEINELEIQGINHLSSYQEFQDRIISNKPMDHGGHSLVHRGLYCFQLEHYFAEWPRDQLLILSISDLKRKEKLPECLRRVFQFIDIPFENIADTEAKNRREYKGELNASTRKRLEDFFRPFNERLFALLGEQVQW